MNMNQWADIVGIIGVIVILIAYYGLNIGKLRALSLSYQFMNFSGAILILFSLFFNWNLPAVLIESCWILVSLIGLYRVYKLKQP